MMDEKEERKMREEGKKKEGIKMVNNDSSRSLLVLPYSVRDDAVRRRHIVKPANLR